MATSLGTLTLDLIARTGGFEAGMDKASRIADKKTKEIERKARERAQAIETAFAGMARAVAGPLAAAFSVAALVDYGRELVRTGAEIQRFSRIAGASTTEFQKYSHGAETAGVGTEKFADIVKDVQDKIGEFINTGGGPLKDFFENIAPKVGVTADEFKKLSGPQALELFYKTLEKAGLSQKEMVFWLEALASDATALQPLLKNNSQGFKDAADEAERFGIILSEDTLAGLEEIRQGGREAQMSFDGWMKQLADDCMPTLLELSRNMDAVKAAISGIGTVGNLVIRGTLNALATAAVTASKSFEYLGTAVGGTLAALSLAGQGEFKAARDTLQALGSDLARIDRELSKSVARIWAGGTQMPTLPKPETNSGTGTSGTGKSKANSGKTGKAKADEDPLTDAAKLYEQAMRSLNDAQLKVDASSLQLTATQTELLRVMSDPLFAQMPEPWRIMIATQGEAVLQAEKMAEEQARLNEILAATPTAQLEKQRSDMELLALAFEQGKISVEQYYEAVAVALGKAPDAAQAAKDEVIDLSTVMNDGARMMASGFVDYLFDPMDKSIGDMVKNFAIAIAKMIAQAYMLKAIQMGMNAMGLPGFAKGGVFDGGLQPFASGGVVDRPTFFRFASGGSFKNGVMGEAGPEAILPLKRGSDGKLGVTSMGAGGDNFNVSIVVNADGTGTESGDANQTGRELANSLKNAVIQVLVNEKRPGGMLYR